MELANFKPNKQTWIYIACFVAFLIAATLIIFHTQNEKPASEEASQEKSDATPSEQPVDTIEYEASSTNDTSSETVATENTKIPTKPEIKTEATTTPAPKVIPKPANNSFSSVFLEKHNAVRSAVNLPPLTWSLALAKEAQAWSEVLKGEGCKMRHDYTTEHGENIYWKSQSDGDISELISSPSDAVYYWAEEKSTMITKPIPVRKVRSADTTPS